MSNDSGSLANQYDRGMRNSHLNEYYGDSGFFNYGYWTEQTPDQATACRNLVEKLLGDIPSKKGAILDVACGLGATTRHLLRYYPASAVTGINISYEQCIESRLHARGIEFLQMDASHLAFQSNTFENVLCVEAAFHFDTRERFLAEAHRILKPGGWLALSDILFMGMPGKRRRRLPSENFVTDLRQYRQLFVRAGFREVAVLDATKESWIGFRNNLVSWGWDKVRAGALDLTTWTKHMVRLLIGTVAIRKYVLVWAQKPS